MVRRGAGAPADERELTDSDQDRFKRLAATRAVDEVRSRSVIGLGTGTTARCVLEELARRLGDGRLHSIVGIPTSQQTAELAARLDIPLGSLDEHPVLDLAIDGADEVDPRLDLVKGHGGALLREKIVAAAARRLLIVIDRSKRVVRLGTTASVPVEVIPFGLALVMRRLAVFPGDARLRRTGDGQPFRTDEGHWIVDYACGPLADPHEMDRALHGIPGIVEHGLFLDMAHRAVVGDADGTAILERP